MKPDKKKAGFDVYAETAKLLNNGRARPRKKPALPPAKLRALLGRSPRK